MSRLAPVDCKKAKALLKKLGFEQPIRSIKFARPEKLEKNIDC